MSRKQIWLVVQVIVTLCLIILLFRNFDWASFTALFNVIPLWFYPLSLVSLFLGQLVYAFRWKLVLKAMGLEIPFREVARQYLISIFFSNFLPTAIGGDWARVYYLGQEKGYVTMTASVFADRFLGFFSMTIFAAALGWWLRLTAPAFLVARDLLSILSVMFVLALVLAVTLPIERASAILNRLDSRLAIWGKRLEQFLMNLRQIGRTPWVIAAAALTVLAYFGLLAITYSVFFGIAAGDHDKYWSILAALMGISILTNIPLTVNGIGLREQLHFILFINLDFPKELSVSISLIIFFDFLIISAIGYLLLTHMTITRNKLAHDSRATEEAGL